MDSPALIQVPTLETSRLLLVPPGIECDRAYQRFYTDAAASAAYGGPLSSAAAWSRLAADLGAWQLRGFGVWGLKRRDEGDIIGTCGFWQGRDWPCELTWWLLPEARGRGYAKEASRAAIEHAYSVFGWAEVRTYMADDNAAARALVESLGGRRVERRRFPDGHERDVFQLPRAAAG